MKAVNEQFSEQFADMQKKTMDSLAPMQNMNNVAAQAFERIARKNYDLMGDLVEYAVAQVKVPEGETDMQKVYESRVADTKAFADKVNARAAEYVELAGELGDMVKATATAETEAAAPAPTAKKAAAKKRTAKAK